MSTHWNAQEAGPKTGPSPGKQLRPSALTLGCFRRPRRLDAKPFQLRPHFRLLLHHLRQSLIQPLPLLVEPLLRMLARLPGATRPGADILSDHPDTQARVDVINTLAKPQVPSQPLLEPSEWQALKRICAGR